MVPSLNKNGRNGPQPFSAHRLVVVGGGVFEVWEGLQMEAMDGGHMLLYGYVFKAWTAECSLITSAQDRCYILFLSVKTKCFTRRVINKAG